MLLPSQREFKKSLKSPVQLADRDADAKLALKCKWQYFLRAAAVLSEDIERAKSGLWRQFFLCASYVCFLWLLL